MDTECNKVDAYLLAVFTDCNVGTVFHDHGKKCGNTPSKRKYKNCWIHGFNTPEITNDYCSKEWADFAQMSVYGAVIGRLDNERE